MFERFTAREPRRRWARVAVSASVFAHVGVGLTLLIAAFWQIDKLSPGQTTPVQMAASGPPSLTQGGAPPPPPPATAVVKKSPKTKIKVKGLRQPTDDVEVEDDVEIADADPNVAGHKDGIAGSRGNNIGSRRIGGIGGGFSGGAFDDDGFRERIETLEKKKDTVVPAHLMRGKRISGKTQIEPAKAVKLAMRRAGTTKIVGMIKMCLSPRGTVRSLSVIKSTGFPTYDAALRRTMRQWRYKPYTANGRAIGVCTVISFVYRLPLR